MEIAGQLMFDNETLDVDEFLCDVSLHLRRRDIRTLLQYLGMPVTDIEELLTENKRLRQGSERGLLTSSGLVVDGSSAINFLEQRKRAMRAWWNYAANTNLRITPAQQNVKIVESRSSTLPGIRESKEGKEGFLVSQLQRDSVGNITNFLGESNPSTSIPGINVTTDEKPDAGETGIIVNIEKPHGRMSDGHREATLDKQSQGQSLLPPVTRDLAATPPIRRGELRYHTAGSSREFPNVSSGPIVQIPSVEVSETASQTHSEPAIGSQTAGGKRIRWGPDPHMAHAREAKRVTVNDAGVTLEELLRKLWRCLQSCGLSRVVDELQQRWMIRVDTKQRKADMFPKMTWGTPPPPQTPFTYPPYKKIGHMAVMGAPMVIETRPLEQSLRAEKVLMSSSLPSSFEILTPRVGDKAQDRPTFTSAGRSPGLRSSGNASFIDGTSSATSFPARDAWKMRTDTVRRRGGSLTAHVLVEHVTLPSHLVASWGSSLHVTPHQMREKAARVFLSYITRDGRDLCRAVDRVERIRGLVVENALKRIVNGTMSSSNMDSVGSELVIQCRCLYPETVEQLWLWYQSGQLRESMQAGLVTKRVRRACAVEHIRLRVYIAEEEYRRALGLLRRKPMPNTKTGRYYVTSGSGGVTGGTSGLTHPQRQALMSVTKYMKLPAPSPTRDMINSYAAALSLPSAIGGGTESDMKGKTVIFGGKRMKPNRALVDKILNKEVLSLRQRVRMCEDEWCEFAARDLSVMLRCARNVMQRRITGITTREQLTPKCISLSLLRSLHKALISRGRNSSTAATPRGTANTTSVTNSHGSIALYPSEVCFSNYDLVASPDDDEALVKSRKQEERDFASAFAHFADLVAELSSCRYHVQEKIIGRLTTNPTVAHSKQLYLTKDIYLLTERWRNLVSKNFNIANDPTVQLLSRQILSDPSMATVIPMYLQEQFPGFIGLLPATFQVADQVLEKLQNLLTSAYGASVGSSMAYPTIPGSDGQRHTISVRLVA